MLKFWAKTVLFLLVFPILVHAESYGDFDPLPLSNINGEASAIVSGCVHVITGDYFDANNDLTIISSEPISLDRYYSSADISQNTLFSSWRHNHSEKLKVAPVNRKDYQCAYFSPFGATLYEKNTSSNDIIVPFTILDNRIGLNNNSTGYISGKTNLKNNYLHIIKHKENYKTLELITGSGEKHSFYAGDPSIFLYHLKTIQKPNGNQVHYTYKKVENYTLNDEVKTTNSSGSKIINWLKFPYDAQRFKKAKTLNVQSSDGRNVTYKFRLFKPSLHDKNQGVKDYFYISEVHSPGKPIETYQYGSRSDEKTHILIQKAKEDNRFLTIEYYTPGQNKVGNTPVKVSNEAIYDRVKLLKAPVGTDSQPIITHRFFYEFNKEDKRKNRTIKSGTTTVYDALNHKTAYLYTLGHRLSEIQHFSGTESYQLSFKEKLYWNYDNTGIKEKKPSQDAYNLLTKAIEDEKGNILCCVSYIYDKQGNVVKGSLWGNITGKNQIPILLKNGTPIENGCEHRNKLSRYSEDDFNLVLEEKEINGKNSLYTYLPNTNLVASHFVYEGPTIRSREFYDYNADGILVKTILDDGCTSDKNDTTNVTQRKITYISPKAGNPGFGLPEVVIEKYLDLKSGSEKLLKKTVNTYNAFAYLVRQDIYDSNDIRRYSIYREYDEGGRVLRESNDMGQVVVNRYDKNGNRIFTQGPNFDVTTEFAYDFSNRLISQTEKHVDGSVFTQTFTYDYLGNKKTSTDIFGNTTQYEYDDFNRLIKTTFPAIYSYTGNIEYPQEKRSYDSLGYLKSVIDSKGYETTYVNNIVGKPTEINYPDGTHEFYEYDLLSNVTKKTEKNGSYTLFTYDYLCREIKKETYSIDGNFLCATSSTYNAFAKTSDVDGNGNITLYDYDGAGRLVKGKKINPSGDSVTEYAYDSLGRLTHTIQRYGEQAEECSINIKEYDLLDRVIEERLEDSLGQILNKKNYVYDISGNLIEQITYGEDHPSIITIAYNSLNQPVKMEDSLGGTSLYRYDYSFKNDINQRVLQKTSIDALGNQTFETFDATNKIACVEKRNSNDSLIAKQKIFYDTNGNPCCILEMPVFNNEIRSTITTCTEYGPANRVEKIIEAFGFPEQRETSFIYNNYGQQEILIKPDGIQLLTSYDAMGHIQKQWSSDSSFSYSYFYDANSNVIQVDDLINNTSTIRSYDACNNLTEEKLGNGISLRFAYDGSGRRKKLELPDGSAVQYIYDPTTLKEVHRLNSYGEEVYRHVYMTHDLSLHTLTMQLPGTAGLLTHKYDIVGRCTSIQTSLWSEIIPTQGYDAVGNLTQLTILKGDQEISNAFAYDDLYQLQEEKGMFNHSYTHDSLNNCLLKDDHEIAHNALNQMLKDDKASYNYNPSGALIGKQEENKDVTYTYDAFNRLISVCSDKEISISFTYDFLHRRLSKIISQWDYKSSSWKPVTTQHFLYDMQNEIGSANDQGIIEELRVLGKGLGAEIGTTIAMELKQYVAVPIHDINGNICCLIDSSTGNALEYYSYSAFGQQHIYTPFGQEIDRSLVDNPWGFASKRIDREIILVYFGRRYYSPEMRRWITPDPKGYEDGPNLYAYVHNNPLTHFDLYGLWDEEVDSSMPMSVKESNTFAGNALMGIGRHCLPGSLRQPVESAGRWLKGGNYACKDHYYDTYDLLIAGHKKSPFGDKMTIVNGLWNTRIGFQKTLNKISVGMNDKEISGCFLPTKGIANDLGEALAWKYTQGTFFDSDSLRSSVNYYKQTTYDDLSDMSTHSYILQVPHSNGAQVAYQGLKEMPASVRNRIVVTTMGAAKLIPPSMARYVHNYGVAFDPVFLQALIYDPFLPNVTIIPFRNLGELVNHCLGEEPYVSKTAEIGNYFMNRTNQFSFLRNNRH